MSVQESLRKVSADLERMREKDPEFHRFLSRVFPRMPRYRYWRVKDDHYAFAYTTERTNDHKFWALKYRITKKAWKLVKKVGFGKRRVAKARAYNWYCQRKAELLNDLLAKEVK